MLAVHQDNLRKVIRSIDGDPLALLAEKTLGLELMKEIRGEMKMPMPTLEGKEPTTHESASSGQAPAKKGLAPAGTSVDDENLKSLSAALAEQMASGLVPAASPPPADTAKTPSSAATAEQMASGLEPAGKNTAMSPTPAKKNAAAGPHTIEKAPPQSSKGPAGATPGSQSSKRKGPPQQKAAAKSRRVANKDEMLHDGTGHGAGKAQQRLKWGAASLNKDGAVHIDRVD